MPHYSDGTAAKIGDQVKGKPYNTPHEVTGVVVGIVPDSEACNVRVAFARLKRDGETHEREAVVKGYDPGGAKPVIVVEVDYGETRAFTKIA